MKPHPPGAVSSLVFGICALVTGLVPFIGVLLGLIATIQSRRADNYLRQDADRYQMTALPVAGFVTGLIGLMMSIFSTLWLFFWLAIIGAVAASMSAEPLPAVEPVLLW
jgi:hypothetical protein